MLKKMTVCLMTFVILVATSVLPSFAAPGKAREGKIIFSVPEIRDKNTLFERAKKGITDVPQEMVVSGGKFRNKQTGKELPVKTYNTTQLLEIKEFPDGLRKERYATTVFLVAQADGSFSWSEWDNTGGVRLSGTIYFNKSYDSQGQETIELYKVNGDYTIYDSTYSIDNQRVKVVQDGYSIEPGSGGVVYQRVWKYPTGFSFEYYPPSEWYPVRTSSNYMIGELIQCDVISRTSIWEAECPVFLQQGW
jgi:hypothetical protein